MMFIDTFMLCLSLLHQFWMKPDEKYYICPIYLETCAYHDSFKMGHMFEKRYNTGSPRANVTKWKKDHHVKEDEDDAKLRCCEVLVMHTQCYRVCLWFIYSLFTSRLQ